MPATTSPNKQIPPAQLHFDRKNPRMVEFGIEPGTKDADILKMLWDSMDVRELVMSIAAHGFFTHETLIVAKEEKKYVVVEGNRRLAAVRLLLNPQLAEKGWDIPKISKQVGRTLEALPVTISSRKDAWRFLGFKHVNGPAKWRSYAKAKYIADVHREYGIPLSKIASQIGDTHRTVRRLYRGLMVLEQAGNLKVYDQEDRYRPHLSFSHLYTGLGYDGFIQYLSLPPLEEETNAPVPPEKSKELREVCVWLYGSKSERIPPVVETQNPHLRYLNNVLSNREATSALKNGMDLASAHELCREPNMIFEDAILAAKRELTKAKASVATGYDKTEGLLRTAGMVATIADSIYEEMERMYKPVKPVRMTEE